MSFPAPPKLRFEGRYEKGKGKGKDKYESAFYQINLMLYGKQPPKELTIIQDEEVKTQLPPEIMPSLGKLGKMQTRGLITMKDVEVGLKSIKFGFIWKDKVSDANHRKSDFTSKFNDVVWKAHVSNK